MFRRSRSFAVASALAAVAATAVPIVGATPAAAMGPCQVKPLFSVIEYNQVVAVTGVYNAPAGATDVELTCGVVRNGVTYAKLTDKLVGPAAALAGTATVPAGSVSSCQEIRVTYLGGATTYSDTCP